MVGLILVSFRGRLTRKLLLERGVLFAFAGALGMGVAGFFTGWGARLTDPLMINFAVCVVLAFFSALYLLAHGRLAESFRDVVTYRRTLVPMIVIDNIAWIAYAVAMSVVPIGIATALSESYIIIAVILGLTVSRERLELHQKVGLVVATIGAITLAAVTT